MKFEEFAKRDKVFFIFFMSTHFTFIFLTGLPVSSALMLASLEKTLRLKITMSL